MWSEEDHTEIWKAGDIAPAGTYIRLDNHSFHRVVLLREEPLPASCDGQVAWYALAPQRLPLPGKKVTPTKPHYLLREQVASL